MEPLRDSIHYQQLARKARQLASAHSDPVVARRLRETAVQHDRLARKLEREESVEEKPQSEWKTFIKQLKRR
ncbi:hypothetical protein [Erythrobacter rubeus]|uniref:Uncharacterized protein n=1 Tax=Erythrobacter rubeus TaxID=2760803 RepID=A0ABR8KN13_9SPHN|nr:hypothetical protein [Erythrobacter rubeus]MBD2840720.1 hypothetical protein [Erythrobacter rubeus]